MLRYSFHPAAEKELARLPIEEQKRINSKIKELCQLNHPLQYPKVKKLKGKKFDEFRLRAGDYRIKFIFRESDTIRITHVQHRQIGY